MLIMKLVGLIGIFIIVISKNDRNMGLGYHQLLRNLFRMLITIRNRDSLMIREERNFCNYKELKTSTGKATAATYPVVP